MTTEEALKDDETNLAVGDEVAWAALNGNVRAGRIVEWFALTATWFVEFYPSGKAKRDKGFSTWLKPEELIKMRQAGADR